MKRFGHDRTGGYGDRRNIKALFSVGCFILGLLMLIAWSSFAGDHRLGSLEASEPPRDQLLVPCSGADSSERVPIGGDGAVTRCPAPQFAPDTPSSAHIRTGGRGFDERRFRSRDAPTESHR
jgi:hypothetical protein